MFILGYGYAAQQWGRGHAHYTEKCSGAETCLKTRTPSLRAAVPELGLLGGNVFEFNTGHVEFGSADIIESVYASEKRLFINWNLLARENLPKSSASYLSTV